MTATPAGAAPHSAEPLLVVQDLKKYYPVQGDSLPDLVGLEETYLSSR